MFLWHCFGITGGSRILVWGARSSAEGASIEAPQAPRERDLGRGVSSLTGRGLRRGCAPLQKSFGFFGLGMVHFECIMTRD